jgi:hypothetical protein
VNLVLKYIKQAITYKRNYFIFAVSNSTGGNKMESNLEKLQNFYNGLVNQYSVSLQIPKLEAKLKVGTLIFYFYAHANNNSELKEKIKTEAGELFNSTGNFFSEAENDFDKMKIERPDLVQLFKESTTEEYDLFVKYVQDDVLLSK